MPSVSLSSGAFDRVVVLQRAQVVKNGLGEPVQTWGDLTTCWAQKTDQAGAEDVRGDQEAAHVTAQFVVRWADAYFRPALNPADRLLFNDDEAGRPEDGLIFNIRSVQEVGRRQAFLITAQARVDQRQA